MFAASVRAKIIDYSTDGPVTVRRAWGMWNAHALFGDDGGSPKLVFNGVYDAYDSIWENVIGTWDGAAVGGYGVIATDGITAGSSTNFCTNSKYVGSIGYLRTDATVPPLIGLGYGGRSVDCFEFKDVVFYAPASGQLPIDASVFDGGTGTISCTSCNRRLTNITEISDTPSYIATGTNGWRVTNRAIGANVGSVPNIWKLGAGSEGARICKRYENGVLTSTPLWPWPMDARIRAALRKSWQKSRCYFWWSWKFCHTTDGSHLRHHSR